MTLAVSTVGSGYAPYSAIWYLINPPTGAQVAQITGNGNLYGSFAVASFSGVDQTTPIAHMQTSGISSNPSLSIVSAVGNLVTDCEANVNGVTPVEAGGQTLLWVDGGGNGWGGGSYVSTVTSPVNLSWTCSQDSILVAVDLLASSAGPAHLDPDALTLTLGLDAPDVITRLPAGSLTLTLGMDDPTVSTAPVVHLHPAGLTLTLGLDAPVVLLGTLIPAGAVTLTLGLDAPVVTLEPLGNLHPSALTLSLGLMGFTITGGIPGVTRNCWTLAYDYSAARWLLTGGGNLIQYTTSRPYRCAAANVFDVVVYNYTGVGNPDSITLWPLSSTDCECPPELQPIPLLLRLGLPVPRIDGFIGPPGLRLRLLLSAPHTIPPYYPPRLPLTLNPVRPIIRGHVGPPGLPLTLLLAAPRRPGHVGPPGLPLTLLLLSPKTTPPYRPSALTLTLVLAAPRVRGHDAPGHLTLTLGLDAPRVQQHPQVIWVILTLNPIQPALAGVLGPEGLSLALGLRPVGLRGFPGPPGLRLTMRPAVPYIAGPLRPGGLTLTMGLPEPARAHHRYPPSQTLTLLLHTPTLGGVLGPARLPLVLGLARGPYLLGYLGPEALTLTLDARQPYLLGYLGPDGLTLTLGLPPGDPHLHIRLDVLDLLLALDLADPVIRSPIVVLCSPDPVPSDLYLHFTAASPGPCDYWNGVSLHMPYDVVNDWWQGDVVNVEGTTTYRLQCNVGIWSQMSFGPGPPFSLGTMTSSSPFVFDCGSATDTNCGDTISGVINGTP